MEVYVEPELEAGLAQQLDALHAAQTAPFLELVSDYAACLQHNRELEVRVAQLDKEVAELRDEVGARHAFAVSGGGAMI
ncbi:hypothetical protein MNEG_5203 [Monoraphidium neglectum]|uniref:Uncharacterized protein n=1 Tax=Monoraphidium neglectum TaxID=145388 RepID=A0A0D2JVC5_9CHLO|nr:hypothetical protein MNEG_5203 [Monoraphidium neglectum]KIZ02753.1 hypothetical protein MNEG_5203 [Monoraphidium neglectum]|eukprot:XP_013901772.1 hypothetical protein MNEG_5203 [Monoraphidium neglectum]